MTNLGWERYARGLVEDSLANLEGWADIVVDLRREGICEEVIVAVLREHHAWTAEILEWKPHGFPYDEIVQHLRDEVAAEWGDVARSLMESGLPPADMLRVVLPILEDAEPLSEIMSALLDGPLDENFEEVWKVIEFFFPGVCEVGACTSQEESQA